MRSSSLLLLSFLVGLCDVQGASEFRVCAFNLQHFGESKSQKTNVMYILTKIITRCDVCLLQEVRDSKEVAVPQLLKRLNSYDTEHEYKAVASERLGRNTYQEQYVFVYRTGTVTVTGQYQYPDTRPGDVDAFSREPFVVSFKAPKTVIKEFVLIPQHTTPTNTTKELDALYDVLQDVKKMFNTENVMLLGDFNADCGYLAKKNRKFVRLITDKNLIWLIPEKTDTTVRESTSCTYDRIVVNGERFVRAIVPSSAKPFNFQKEYKLTEEQALEVSDHYSVEVLLKEVAPRSSVNVSGGTSPFLSWCSRMLKLSFYKLDDIYSIINMFYGNQGDADFLVGLQKYVIPGALYAQYGRHGRGEESEEDIDGGSKEEKESVTEQEATGQE